MVRHLLSHQNLADASPVFSYKYVPVFTEDIENRVIRCKRFGGGPLFGVEEEVRFTPRSVVCGVAGGLPE